MTRRSVIRAAILLYPREFRALYGRELEDLVAEVHERDGRSFCLLLLDVVAAGAAARLRSPARLPTTGLAVLLAALGVVFTVQHAMSSGSAPASIAAQYSAGLPAPKAPTIESMLAPSVAAVPGIVRFLESSAPKTVETDGAKIVWVGKGHPSVEGLSSSGVPKNVVTLAGTYRRSTG